MSEPTDILISVLPHYVERFLSGAKTVELRRRPIMVAPESRVWIYSKRPRGVVELLAVVASVHVNSPRTIWRKFGDRTGLLRCDFDKYFEGIKRGCAIEFSEVVPLNPVLPIQSIRVKVGRFLPPQFFRTLPSNCVELALFRSAAKAGRHAQGFCERGLFPWRRTHGQF